MEQGRDGEEEGVKGTDGEISNVARANWRGGLPVFVEVDTVDFEEQPLPTFLFINRQTYLGHALASAVSAYRSRCVVPKPLQRVWFSSHGIPLNWQYPVGAIFDTLCSQSKALPFKLKVHFSMPLSATGNHSFLTCPDVVEMQRSFFHWFKQGMYIKYDSRLPFTEFRETDDEMLWEGVAGSSIDKYWKAFQRMKDFETKKYPVRLLYAEKVDEKSLPPMRLACRQVAAQRETVMRTLIQTHVPRLEDVGRCVILCQGVEVPLDVQVSQIYERLSHPDLFLYVCIFRNA